MHAAIRRVSCWCRGRSEQAGCKAKTSPLLQTEPHECGVVCLSIVLSYHGVHIPVSELRQTCGTGREGFRMDYLAQTARLYGLKAKGVAAASGKLAHMPFPLIALWNFEHLVVVEAISSQTVSLNDPASGRIDVSREAFDEAYSGVALVFSKGAEFKPLGNRPRLATALAARLKGSRRAFLFVVVSSLGLIVPGWLLPSFIRQFVDQYLTDRQEYWLFPLLIGMALVVMLRGGFTHLQQDSLSRLQTKLAMTWGATFFWHMLRLPLNFFSERHHGDLSNRFKYADRVALLVAGQLTEGVMNLVSVVFYGLIMLQYDVGLAGISFVTVALGWLLLAPMAHHVGEASERWYLERGNFFGTALNGLKLREQFKIGGNEGALFSRLAARHARVIGANQSQERQRILLRAGTGAFGALHGILVLVYGAELIMTGRFTVGMLIAYQVLAVGFIMPVVAMIGLNTRLHEAKAMLGAMDEIMEHPIADEFAREQSLPRALPQAAVQEQPPPEAGPSWRGRIEVENVTFAFNPFDAPVIEGINLTIEAGARVALVGPSGCGRSTFARLIAGLYTPTGGDIRFDGKALKTIPRAEFRNHVTMLQQSEILFDTSLRNNLTLWDDSLPEEQMVAAAKAAMIHEVIVTREGGYDHEVSANGANFSSGERQRLEIARVLAQQPRVLIMDESTSYLDALVEARIMENIRRLGMTSIFIAHRLSTIRDCNLIVYMERGRIVEQGTHEDLMKNGWHYPHLVETW
ncbi:MAG: ATP-binding cassette domain-containing protein [Alphaproteobacteria bacterium]|nr:ATP-binding cassette domain-containing protein [Alphaproteobacteria bacterium]